MQTSPPVTSRRLALILLVMGVASIILSQYLPVRPVVQEDLKKWKEVPTNLARLVGDSIYSPDHTHRLCPIINPTGTVQAGPENHCVNHHSAFSRFLPLQWSGPFQKDIVRDFVGVETAYLYDCANFRYRPNHLERQIPCNEHDAYRLRAKKDPACTLYRFSDASLFAYLITIVTYPGAFPVATEEYWEWVDTLSAVAHAVDHKRKLVYMEMGARYGTWLARAASAYRLLARHEGLDGENFLLVGVEGDITSFDWMHEHFKMNEISNMQYHSLNFALSDAEDGEIEIKFENEARKVKTLTIPKLLKNYNYVDLLNFDIQGFEYESCSFPGAMEAITSKVRIVHFGTHGDGTIHKNLLELFGSYGWTTIHNFPGDGISGQDLWAETWGKFTDTEFGKVYFNDGVLSFFNPKFEEP